jgi:hypothetical protein
MRLAVFAAGIVLAFTGMVVAQPYDTPETLLQAFYARYSVADFDFSDEAEFRSKSLQALYDADAQATPEGEVGALDFDPFIDGQDWELSDLQIGPATITGDHASDNVTFKNFGEVRTLSYDLVKEDGGWKINDVQSTSPDNEYRLSEIFALAHTD